MACTYIVLLSTYRAAKKPPIPLPAGHNLCFSVLFNDTWRWDSNSQPFRCWSTHPTKWATTSILQYVMLLWRLIPAVQWTCSCRLFGWVRRAAACCSAAQWLALRLFPLGFLKEIPSGRASFFRSHHTVEVDLDWWGIQGWCQEPTCPTEWQIFSATLLPIPSLTLCWAVC